MSCAPQRSCAAGPPPGIVVIGRNEGDRLRRCLRSLPRGAPLVYVDSGSTDGSVDFAQAEGARVVRLDLSHPFTAARARNEGLQLLLLRWPDIAHVQFVDGDCELEDGWLECAHAFLEANPTVAVACGRRRERFRDASLYNRWMDQEWDTPIGAANACGGDALIRVGALAEVGGYDSSLIAGEEPELCARLRLRGWFIQRLDRPMTIHDANMHFFREWWFRCVRSGYGYAKVWAKTRRLPGGAVYGGELTRVALWTAGPPALSLVLMLFVGALGVLLAPALWGAQFLRLSLRHGRAKGSHLLISKFAELFGALRYAITALSHVEKRGIFYK